MHFGGVRTTTIHLVAKGWRRGGDLRDDGWSWLRQTNFRGILGAAGAM